MKIYNTLTKKKEEFEPIKQGEVGIYACGPTVYNYFHIGNARPFIIFDTLRRYFEYLGYKVTFVQNFTDIDDKMIQKANSEGVTVAQLAQEYIDEYYKDADALGIKRATVNPRATENIPEIIALIQKLIDNGHAYVAQNGDVYYETKTFKDYGKLSGQNLDDLEDGARIETGDIKKNNSDFAIWKAKKEGEPYWQSPWGEGRPGWHIECSAMSMKYLGETFDIHCGGMDLIFPHHENEIAQSEGATNKPFAHYWMHNGYINIDNRKMSKSAGNFFTVRDIAKEFDLEAVRLFMLDSHYRKPINFSHDLIEHAQTALERLKNAKSILQSAIQTGTDESETDEMRTMVAESLTSFKNAMDDDLNTADAIGTVFEFVRFSNTYFNQARSKKDAVMALNYLEEVTGVLGLLQHDDTIPQDILDMVEKRKQARDNKDWALSDKLRDEIAEKGYSIEDSKTGAIIKKL